jgi:hypothetical protein
MKRSLLIALSVLAVSASLVAQQGAAPPPPPPLEPGASQADVDKALLAAPARLRDQATVIKWKSDLTNYDTLRKGTNKLVCFDISGYPLNPPFSVECTNLGNLPRVSQNLKFESSGDRAKLKASTDAAEKDGSRVKPEFGSVWYHQRGPDKDHMQPHMTIAVPGANEKTMGLPESGRGGGVWIMDAGTTTAHLMVPGE